MAKRATLCRVLLEPWGVGKTHEDCVENAVVSVPGLFFFTLFFLLVFID